MPTGMIGRHGCCPRRAEGSPRSFWGSGVPCSPLRLCISHLGKDANPFAGGNWVLVERVVSLTPCLTVAGLTFLQCRVPEAADGRKPAQSRLDLSPTRKRADHASLQAARPGFATSPPEPVQFFTPALFLVSPRLFRGARVVFVSVVCTRHSGESRTALADSRLLLVSDAICWRPVTPV